MIKFKNLVSEKPYSIFEKKYKEALEAGQRDIEAISISSYDKDKNEVDSRYVNLKFIDRNRFIFFTNYSSPKAIAFESHDQIAAAFFWSATNVQIRIKAKIKKTSLQYNKNYFKKRSKDKNALAISSNQSQIISSYNEIIKNYNATKDEYDLSLCPDYWGGYYFVPFSFEFWEGHQSRLNKRVAYEDNDGSWIKKILQP